MADEVVLPYPNLSVAQNVFVLANPAIKSLHKGAQAELVASIEADGASPCLFVHHMC